jgi:pSer/pThr/pTyr-binding forkhead associated (FHA) protein
MVECLFCQATHVDNTLFCDECGAYLHIDNKPETDPLDVDEKRWLGNGKSANNSRSTSPVRRNSTLRAVQLKIGARKLEVEILINKAVNVGRTDPASTTFPEIDLSDGSTLAKSVSRRHARLLKQGNVIVVEDLGSVNGTFINGKRLAPYLPETLADGDTIQFGKMLVEIRIRK